MQNISFIYINKQTGLPKNLIQIFETFGKTEPVNGGSLSSLTKNANSLKEMVNILKIVSTMDEKELASFNTKEVLEKLNNLTQSNIEEAMPSQTNEDIKAILSDIENTKQGLMTFSKMYPDSNNV